MSVAVVNVSSNSPSCLETDNGDSKKKYISLPGNDYSLALISISGQMVLVPKTFVSSFKK